ncbi:hypothetical protein CDZ97_10280 [Mameliella alba]|uniref:hypothetical protein n=1 Tax=Mameliella alba TaxID=561184 RepID=UPI000B53341E|nr:hypothetical protein [Mameliella alba]OWV64265.1 hypothetical protein CDZ97_10280 [Mameliella alba]
MDANADYEILQSFLVSTSGPPASQTQEGLILEVLVGTMIGTVIALFVIVRELVWTQRRMDTLVRELITLRDKQISKAASAPGASSSDRDKRLDQCGGS